MLFCNTVLPVTDPILIQFGLQQSHWTNRHCRECDWPGERQLAFLMGLSSMKLIPALIRVVEESFLCSSFIPQNLLPMFIGVFRGQQIYFHVLSFHFTSVSTVALLVAIAVLISFLPHPTPILHKICWSSLSGGVNVISICHLVFVK